MKKPNKSLKEKVISDDLDNGYINPILSYKDISIKNIKDIIIHSKYIQLLLSLTIMGIFLRIYNIGFNSLWLDEATTYSISTNTFEGIWKVTTSGEFNPPLFYWIEHIMLMLGNSEIILRLFPAMCGILTIPLIYVVGKEFMNKNVGIITAALFTFSPFLIFYSQEARAYSFMLFLVTASMVCYFKALKNNSIIYWVAFGTLSALAFWSHFYALVIYGALTLYSLYKLHPLFLKGASNLVPLFTSWVWFFVITSPLLIVTIDLFGRRTSSSPTYGIQGIGIVMATFTQMSWSDILTYIFILLFIIGIIQAFIVDISKGIFLISIAVLTFVISNYLSFLIPMVPRYLIFLTIIFFIAISMTYKIIFKIFQTKKVVYGFLIVIMCINIPILMGYYSNYSKEDWRGLGYNINRLTNDGDVIVAIPGYITHPLNYYYSNTSDKTIEIMATNSTELSTIKSQQKNYTIFYIVTGDISAANPEGDAVQWLDTNTKVLTQNMGIYIMI